MVSKSIELNGKTYSLDQHGFLDPASQWDEAFAEGIAPELGIYGGLSDRHWDMVRYLRRKFVEEKTVPTVVAACADLGFHLRELRFLFPTGYHRGACKLAGIDFEFMFRTNYWLTCESSPIRFGDYRTDALGFLERFEDWDEQFAVGVIREWRLLIGLTDRHRQIIGFLREHYERHRAIPSIYETCQRTDLTLEELGRLFPPGYRRGACLIAGLPLQP
jgi:tRNA 2-thiouridine synthesizing protein E